jgi:hypothetical protein
MKRLIAALVALALFSPSVMADIIIFKSGSAREGIIEEETPTSVKMRVKSAVIGFSRDNIERIEHSSSAENRKLDEKWKEQEKAQEEKRRKRREEKRLHEKRQSDKGLEKVGEEWVSRRRKAEIKQEQIESQARALERERAEEELERLREDASTLREGETEEDLLARNIAQIVVGKFSVEGTEERGETLQGRITNKGKLIADIISLQIDFYDHDGKLVGRIEEEIYGLGPKKHQILEVPLDFSSSLIGGTEVRVTNVVLR